MMPLTNPLLDVFYAARRIQHITQRTPLLLSDRLTEKHTQNCYLKMEIRQPTGSFKLRGATNKILSLSDKERERGIITVSTGNHGRAVAYVAHELGIKATVCISERVPDNKVKSLQKLGANVVIYGKSQDEAEVRAIDLMTEHGYSLIHPFDDPYIIAGQGTIGLEIMQSLPDTSAILVPLSGGGLISGIALAVKSINPKVQIIGVSMQGACVMYHSLQAGKPIEMPEQDTLADSLLGGIGLENQHTYSIVQNYVDDIILVNEDDIAQAMALLFHEHHAVVEGAGAVGVAALMSGKFKANGHVVSVISGGNVDTATLLNIASDYRRE